MTSAHASGEALCNYPAWLSAVTRVGMREVGILAPALERLLGRKGVN